MTVDDYVKRNDRRAVHFVTLTVPDGLKDERELSGRVNSIRDAILERYGGGVRVYERHKSGAVHIHLVLVYRRPQGLRECSWRKVGRRQTLHSPGPGWMGLWKWWRELASRYRFGRVECLPVRKPERAGNYVAKYLGKGEYEWEKGTRVYAVWKLRVISQRAFSFVGGRASHHRKFMRWMTGTGGTVEAEERALERMKDLWGNKWMRVIWWHVQEGWAGELQAQFLGVLGVSDRRRERAALLAEREAWEAFGTLKDCE